MITSGTCTASGPRAVILTAVVAAALGAAPAAALSLAYPDTVVGRVVDATSSLGIHFALVTLSIPGAEGGHTTATTSLDGSFALTLPPGDDSDVHLSIIARGYFQFHQWSSGPALLQRPLMIALAPAPYRADTVVTGIVYDATAGPAAPLAGAELQYLYHSYQDTYPEVSGTLQTDNAGRYVFQQPLGPYDSVRVIAVTPGFAPRTLYAGAEAIVDGILMQDVALAPIGGLIAIDPPELNLHCSGTFDLTISNQAPPGEDLVILDLDFHFHYGGGVYGTAFAWDLGDTQFPLVLGGGESFTFPVSYFSGRDNPSRLEFSVLSGARDGAGGAAYYNTCISECAGDCDNDQTVSIDELLRGVGIALGRRGVSGCAAINTDGDAFVSISELVAAVDRALTGCR